jgi:hypothetical protein
MNGDFDPRELYDQFPSGADNEDEPPPPPSGWVWVNNPDLFTDEAKEDPLIGAFLSAPFAVSMGLFKSSTREAELAVHMPHIAMAGDEDGGIRGRVERFPENPDDVQISTLILNHERTLAVRKLFAIVVEDGARAGQMIYKQHRRADEGEGQA